jgi:hypothetical protein
MEITAAYLDQQIDALTTQHRTAVAQANALDGALQLARQLRAHLDTPAPQPPPEPAAA